jgi:hypothetical protein
VRHRNRKKVAILQKSTFLKLISKAAILSSGIKDYSLKGVMEVNYLKQ